MQGDIFPSLMSRLENREPPMGSSRHAAVSVIISSREAPKTLLIKRAYREGDPWSEQVAFPGGKAQEGDRSAKETAARETLEEVGIDLDSSSEFLGYFGSFRTHTGSMDVVPSLFLLRKSVAVKANEEVSSYRWVELGRLLSPEARGSYNFSFLGGTREMPAFCVDDYVIWGLTHRILSSLFSVDSHSI